MSASESELFKNWSIDIINFHKITQKQVPDRVVVVDMLMRNQFRKLVLKISERHVDNLFNNKVMKGTRP
jgi:hypothetical protein